MTNSQPRWNWRLGNPAAGRNSPASIRLDAVRAIAALAVFLGHLKGLMFVDYRDVEHPSPWLRVLYFFFGLGHEAVVVFFVLSGFFISQSIVRSESKGRWDTVDYAIVRLTRLQVVLIPALILTFLWDYVGTNIVQGPAYAGNYAHIIFAPVQASSGWLTGLANALFLQGVNVPGLGKVPTFGSNGPLWSLSYEFWYYVAFPLLFFGLAVRQGASIARGACVVLALVCGAFVGPIISSYFLIWLMGWLLGVIPPIASLGKWSIAVSGVVFAGALAQAKLHPLPNAFLQDFALGIAFSAFMYSLMHARGSETKPSLSKFVGWAAGSSFTLYLVHLPFSVLLVSLLIPSGNRWQPTLANLGMLFLVASVVAIYSTAIWWLTEDKTPWVRDWFRNRVGGQSEAVRR